MKDLIECCSVLVEASEWMDLTSNSFMTDTFSKTQVFFTSGGCFFLFVLPTNPIEFHKSTILADQYT